MVWNFHLIIVMLLSDGGKSTQATRRNKLIKKRHIGLIDPELKKIFEAANESESMELKIFQNAVIKNLKSFQESPTKANKKNLDAARDGFEQKKSDLTKKYLSPKETSPSFPSLLAAMSHLDTAGFKISKSKIYRDKDKNFIQVQPDGSVLETEVRAYAATLERKGGTVADLNDIHARKTAKEVESLEMKIKKQRFEYDKEQGKYIPRQEFEAELAARAVVFEAGFRHAFNIHVREWIALVGGKPDKAADFLASLNKRLDEQLNIYASLNTYQVMFMNEGEN